MENAEIFNLCACNTSWGVTKAQTEHRRDGRMGKEAEEALFLLCVSDGWRIMARRETVLLLPHFCCARIKTYF